MRLCTFLTVCLFCTQVWATDAHIKHAAVAMPDAFSEQVAREVLQQGGNAVDAAIAAQFVLAVTFPEAGNIGGGGFMTLWFDQQAAFLDYREKAPGSAHETLFLDDKGEVVPNLSLYGALASGVPGSVAGMWAAHKKYGSMHWHDLLAPAVKLARDGFIVPEKLAAMVERYISKIEARQLAVNFATHFAHMRAGQVFVQSDLAATLERIQKQGADGFYRGKTATFISAFMSKHGGLINRQDLAGYRAKWRTPITQPWRDFTLLTSPPPSSGGIAISQWLTMYDIAKSQLSDTQLRALSHNSTGYIHLLSEVGKRVFADRAEYLGDPDFYNVPLAGLIDKDYLVSRASGISATGITETESVRPGVMESEETTHFSIVDGYGNAVSNTTTINLGFGSGMVVEGAGFLLNDEMDDFSSKPGVANYFGALGGDANAVGANKRMLSSMTPTIVLKDKMPYLVTGSPGGTTILTSVYQSILNVVEHDFSAEQAVNMPRFHHQLFPKNVIRMHPGIRQVVLNQLKQLGYSIDDRRFGDLHLIINHKGKLDAASEKSGRGVASVFEIN